MTKALEEAGLRESREGKTFLPSLDFVFFRYHVGAFFIEAAICRSTRFRATRHDAAGRAIGYRGFGAG